MNVARRRTLALLVGVAAGTACAAGPRSAAWNAGLHARLATGALLADDFESARAALHSLATRCSAGAHGRRAVLLLAAAELDVANANRSPAAAAWWAERYLLLPDTPREEVILARALYRLAVDYGGLEGSGAQENAAPPVASRFSACASPPDPVDRDRVPTPPEQTHASSMRRLRRALQESQAQVLHLENEIRRIGQLLTGRGPAGGTP
jgi:hypothetical protein